MKKPKTVTVYILMCKKWSDGWDVKRDDKPYKKCCRIIPYKLRIPKERKP